MKLYIQHPTQTVEYESPEGETISELLKKAGANLDIIQFGRSIPNKSMLVASLYDEGDIVLLKQVAPAHYFPITKYTFYELNEMNVRVIVELKDISKLPIENFQARFFERSFEIKIHDYQNKNWAFGIGRTQCAMKPEGCKFTLKGDKLLITLHKVKKDDNWFSIHKQKTIGGTDSD